MFNELTMHLLPFDLAVMMLLTLLWLLHFNFVGYDDSIEVSTIHIDKSIDMACVTSKSKFCSFGCFSLN